MRPDVVFAYVRDLLERMTGIRPEQDSDGDLPVELEGAQFFVRVVGEHDPWVQVFAIALADVPSSPGLLERLNEINSQLRFARTFWASGQVLFESDIWADDLSAANFGHACRNIAGATDSFSPRLVSTFGGRAVFQESKDEEYQDSWASRGMGFYL